MDSRRTRVLGGNGTQTQSFELAPGILQYVQSVLVEIDTSGSGNTTPLLTVKTSDGTPVADKPQGRSLDGGGSGRATWALRLDDEVEAVTASNWYELNHGNFNPLSGGSAFTAGVTLYPLEVGSSLGGDDLLDWFVNGTPDHPLVNSAGIYTFTLIAQCYASTIPPSTPAFPVNEAAYLQCLTDAILPIGARETFVLRGPNATTEPILSVTTTSYLRPGAPSNFQGAGITMSVAKRTAQVMSVQAYLLVQKIT